MKGLLGLDSTINFNLLPNVPIEYEDFSWAKINGGC